MKIGQKVRFWIDQDDSGYASEHFGVEPQNDWYDVQYYPEQVEGVIVKVKGAWIARHRYGTEKDVYDLSKAGIERRIQGVKENLKFHKISEEDFFCECETQNFSLFREVELIKEWSKP